MRNKIIRVFSLLLALALVSAASAQRSGQVRNFRPSDLSTCQLWLAADLIPGLTDGAAVTTWPDRSGNARDAAQSTSGNKPIYKTNQIAGDKPIVRFDGTDDYLITSSFTVSTPMRVFLVVKPNSFVNGHRLFDGGTANQAG